jgi:hypothetical protein
MTRFREKLAVPGGGRDDEMIFEYFNLGRHRRRSTRHRAGGARG